MNQVLLVTLTVFLFFLGTAGSILPFLPGPPLAWSGLLIYGLATDFSQVTVSWVIAFGVLSGLVMALDAFAPVLGAKSYKASRLSVVLSILGVIIAPFVSGPFGIIIGPLIGAFIGEYLTHSDKERALRVAWGSFVGFLAGTGMKLIVIIAMAVYFIMTLI